jgi:hypothetical protein
MPWLARAAGVAEIWFPGSRGAEALAALLFDDVNFTARRPGDPAGAQRLVGFIKVALKAGESKSVTVPIDPLYLPALTSRGIVGSNHPEFIP